MSAMGHVTPPGAVPVAVAVQVTSVPVRVPCAVPATCTLPMHVAVNVPDPLVPEISVMVQLKLVHVFVRVVADDTDAHCPAEIPVGVVCVGEVVLLSENRFEQPASSRGARQAAS